MREESSTGTGDISKDGASAWRTDRALRAQDRRRRQPRPATGEADGPVELMTSPSSDDDQQHDPDQNKKNGYRTGYDEHSAGAPSPNVIGRPPLIITVAVDHREEHLGLQHEEDERTRPRCPRNTGMERHSSSDHGERYQETVNVPLIVHR